MTPDTSLTCPPVDDPLELAIRLVTDAVSSPHTRRSYRHTLTEFHRWRSGEGYPFNRATVMAWRALLEDEGRAPATINLRLAAVRKLAREAALNGLLDRETAAAIDEVASIPQRGARAGNWLTHDEAERLMDAPETDSLQGKRDRAALALLLGCALRREEAAQLDFDSIQMRDGRWVIVDLVGKGRRLRTVAVPDWVKAAIDDWAQAAGLTCGRILRSVTWDELIGESLSGTAIWQMATSHGRHLGIQVRPHDLRRTSAKLCRAAGSELEQIQLYLGHASVQTTERYLGTKQDLVNAPNDQIKWREK